jgi:threonine 3-dehydrogenase
VAKTCVGGVDVRDKDELGKLFKEHAGPETTVWNLASPLSVRTALSPEVAQEVVIGGMKNVLGAMKSVGCRRICFTDSIGSFGATSPRENVSARWLVDNPTQYPGSDYGLQKRACRELLDVEFAQRDGGDPRIAILPGVLHAEPIWGNGTTGYALDAMLAASRGQEFECPIDLDVKLPMVFVDDLMCGLTALQMAPESELREPQRLYNMPGLTFTAAELFREISAHVPGFMHHQKINANMDKFAKLWPDTLSPDETLRDLDYEPEVTLPRMVAAVLNAHSGRRMTSRAGFRSIDTCDSGRINPHMLEKFVRKHLVRGRETYGHTALLNRQDMVGDIVVGVLKELDTDSDGVVSLDDFLEWSRVHNLETLVDDYAAAAWEKERSIERLEAQATSGTPYD